MSSVKQYQKKPWDFRGGKYPDRTEEVKHLNMIKDRDAYFYIWFTLKCVQKRICNTIDGSNNRNEMNYTYKIAACLSEYLERIYGKSFEQGLRVFIPHGRYSLDGRSLPNVYGIGFNAKVNGTNKAIPRFFQKHFVQALEVFSRKMKDNTILVITTILNLDVSIMTICACCGQKYRSGMEGIHFRQTENLVSSVYVEFCTHTQLKVPPHNKIVLSSTDLPINFYMEATHTFAKPMWNSKTRCEAIDNARLIVRLTVHFDVCDGIIAESV
jgi:hypothetical protein